MLSRGKDLFARVPTLKALFCEVLSFQSLSIILNVCFVTKLRLSVVDDVARASYTGKVSCHCCLSRSTERPSSPFVVLPLALFLDQYSQCSISVCHFAACNETNRTKISMASHAAHSCPLFIVSKHTTGPVALSFSLFLLCGKMYGLFIPCRSNRDGTLSNVVCIVRATYNIHIRSLIRHSRFTSRWTLKVATW